MEDRHPAGGRGQSQGATPGIPRLPAGEVGGGLRPRRHEPRRLAGGNRSPDVRKSVRWVGGSLVLTAPEQPNHRDPQHRGGYPPPWRGCPEGSNAFQYLGVPGGGGGVGAGGSAVGPPEEGAGPPGDGDGDPPGGRSAPPEAPGPPLAPSPEGAGGAPGTE